MKRVLLILLSLSLCGCAMSYVKMRGVSAGDTLYARSNLTVRGDTIFWHNMSALKEIIPVGTEIKIVKFSESEITFTIPGDDKKYRLVAETGYYDKFFVKNKQDIGLDKISPAVMEEIKRSKISNGMTKSEVLIAKGCPAYIAWGEKSMRHSLEDVMDSNTWYYNLNVRARECLVRFDKNNRVSDIESY